MEQEYRTEKARSIASKVYARLTNRSLRNKLKEQTNGTEDQQYAKTMTKLEERAKDIRRGIFGGMTWAYELGATVGLVDLDAMAEKYVKRERARGSKKLSDLQCTEEEYKESVKDCMKEERKAATNLLDSMSVFSELEDGITELETDVNILNEDYNKLKLNQNAEKGPENGSETTDYKLKVTDAFDTLKKMQTISGKLSDLAYDKRLLEMERDTLTQLIQEYDLQEGNLKKSRQNLERLWQIASDSRLDYNLAVQRDLDALGTKSPAAPFGQFRDAHQEAQQRMERAKSIEGVVAEMYNDVAKVPSHRHYAVPDEQDSDKEKSPSDDGSDLKRRREENLDTVRRIMERRLSASLQA